MKFSKEIMKGSLEVIVLHVLEEAGEAYGYQIIKMIKDQSQEIFDLQETTLYPLLYRLESKGLLQSDRKQAPSGKERRYYSVTPKGRKVLKTQHDEFKLYLKGMKDILHLST